MFFCEQGKFTAIVYQKLTFSGEYTQFDSFLPNTFKVGIIFKLLNRCFLICSNLSFFHSQMALLKGTFWKNGYHENFID